MGAMEKSVHTAEYAALRAALRNMREEAGLSQRGLAARLDVPHSWVAKVEAGERRIDLVEFGWFAAACGAAPLAVLERLLPKIVATKTNRPPPGGRAK
jgi:transcriptional regulator with XRE-family HTH domain